MKKKRGERKWEGGKRERESESQFTELKETMDSPALGWAGMEPGPAAVAVCGLQRVLLHGLSIGYLLSP